MKTFFRKPCIISVYSISSCPCIESPFHQNFENCSKSSL